MRNRSCNNTSLASKEPSSKAGSVRIIGGKLRGRKINFSEYAQENALRPTPDRVRETLFNWLSPVIVEAECLDAFGGSGALGFEAVSRGAKKVTIVEKCLHTFKSIQQNASRLGLSSELTCLCEDTLTYLTNTTQTFDIIFLDPPFQGNLLAECFDLIAAKNLLKPKGYIYLESDSPIMPDNMPSNWTQHRAKKAGSVHYELWLYAL
jgi:16S rRNA (guanine966-N2)-methyltransferase